MATPAQRFWRDDPAPITALRPATTSQRPVPTRPDGTWVSRRASAVRVVMVSWQQVCLGVAAAGHNIDVWVTNDVLQFYDGDQLLRTERRLRRDGELETIDGPPPGQITSKRASRINRTRTVNHRPEPFRGAEFSTGAAAGTECGKFYWQLLSAKPAGVDGASEVNVD